MRHLVYGPKRTAVAIAAGYALFAGSYILGSSAVLANLRFSPEQERLVEVLKGLAFVLITSTLLWRVLDRFFSRLTQANEQLGAATAQLTQAHQASTAAILAATVAHEMKNMLAVVHANSAYVRNASQPLAEEHRNALDDVISAVNRMERLTQDLMARAAMRGENATHERVDMEEALRTCIRIANLFVRFHHSHVHLHVAANVVIVADRSQLEHAVLNLLINAIEATREHGRVDLDVEQLGNEVLLRVTDNGPGLSPAAKEHLFEPFFTTKGKRGTGLGLSVTRETMRRMGGEVRYVAGTGKGAVFELRLPLQPPPAGPSPLPQSGVRPLQAAAGAARSRSA